MTGWNEHGHAVKTGLPIDRYLGHGDLQDAENCGYAPVSVLAELGVDTTFGDPQVQYRDGRIRLLDGTLLERGGTLNCVWAVTVLPAAKAALAQVDVDNAWNRGYERGVADGRRQATEGWDREWGVRSPAGGVEVRRDERGARRLAGYHEGARPVSRLVGPWEPAEQAKPTCTCPQFDVTTLGKRPGSETMQGYDPACPVCPNPYAEQDGDDRG